MDGNDRGGGEKFGLETGPSVPSDDTLEILKESQVSHPRENL